MSAWRIARLGAVLIVLVVLVVSGSYMLIYLYRWEWSRALISGLFFVAALITFSTTLILRSLRHLRQRIDSLEGTTDVRGAVSEENAKRADRHFDWLREPPSSLSVFIPVLLGAGVLLSFVAWVLERLAGTVAGPTLDARTARLVEPDLPLGDGTPVRPSASAADSNDSPVGRVVGWFVALSVAAVLIAGAIDAIGDATQSRPEAVGPGSTTIELRISQRSDSRPPEAVAEALTTACRARLPANTELVEVIRTGDSTAQLTLDHELGDLRRRRFFGCLEDLTLDLVLAEVEAHEVAG